MENYPCRNRMMIDRKQLLYFWSNDRILPLEVRFDMYDIQES
jgi:hypothetical protein